MSLQAAFSLLLESYPAAITGKFAGSDLAAFIRHDVPKVIEEHIANGRYFVQGSPGQGNWARVPWIAVFDTLITDTAQDGYYIVYLVREDFAGIYLSLNQGITTVKERYGSDAKKALRARTDDFLARLPTVPAGFEPGEIDLASREGSSLSAYYEVGAICSRFYPSSAIPDHPTLLQDLDTLLSTYFALTATYSPSSKAIEREDDEAYFEDLTRIRLHKRIERNQRLAKAVKRKKGNRCEACGFSYGDKYCGLDVDYIEAHHLVPLSDLDQPRVKMDPLTDFAVLCADCHRMIHRSTFCHDIHAFRAKHLKANAGVSETCTVSVSPSK